MSNIIKISQNFSSGVSNENEVNCAFAKADFERLNECKDLDDYIGTSSTAPLEYEKLLKQITIKDKLNILDIGVGEHLDLNDLISKFSECERVLSKNGVIFIRVPNATAINNPILYGDLTHKRAFTIQSLNQLANFSNLSINLFDGVYFENKRIFGFVRELIMYIFYYPFLKLFYRLVYGDKIGGHYSANVY